MSLNLFFCSIIGLQELMDKDHNSTSHKKKMTTLIHH